jgi:hypothetical protein
VVDIPDEGNLTADEVRDALCFGIGYWNEMLGPLLDDIKVEPQPVLTPEQNPG